MKKSKSANHRFWYLENKDFMKKQNKIKSHKKKEDLKAEKKENIMEKSGRKNNILDSHGVYNWEKFLQHFDLYIDD